MLNDDVPGAEMICVADDGRGLGVCKLPSLLKWRMRSTGKRSRCLFSVCRDTNRHTGNWDG